MEILRPSELGMDNAIMRLRQLLDNAEIIAYRQKTFYGLGVKYNQGEALERLYHIKQRFFCTAYYRQDRTATLLSPVISPAADDSEILARPAYTYDLRRRKISLPILRAITGKVAVRLLLCL